MTTNILKRKLDSFLLERGFSENAGVSRLLLSLGFVSSPPSADYTVRQSGFFLLTPSPWPLFSSFSVFLMLTGFAAYMNYYSAGLFCFLLGVFFVCCAFFF